MTYCCVRCGETDRVLVYLPDRGQVCVSCLLDIAPQPKEPA